MDDTRIEQITETITTIVLYLALAAAAGWPVVKWIKNRKKKTDEPPALQ